MMDRFQYMVYLSLDGYVERCIENLVTSNTQAPLLQEYITHHIIYIMRFNLRETGFGTYVTPVSIKPYTVQYVLVPPVIGHTRVNIIIDGILLTTLKTNIVVQPSQHSISSNGIHDQAKWILNPFLLLREILVSASTAPF